MPIHAGGKKVVIIGGGDTGADCLGTSHRQGAEEIYQFEIMPRPPEERPEANPWPTWPFVYRTSSAHEEGGERVFSVNTLAFEGDGNGRLRALRVVDVEQQIVDGRPQFVPVEGTERELEADLVFLAMGFTGPERSGLLEAARRRAGRSRQRRARRRLGSVGDRGVRRAATRVVDRA